MTFEEASASLKIPVGVIARLYELRVVGSTLNPGDIHFLKKYSKVWRDPGLLRRAISRIDRSERYKFLLDGFSRIERVIVSRFYKHYSEGKGGTLYSSKVIDELVKYHNAKESYQLKALVKKLRRKAWLMVKNNKQLSKRERK